MLAKKKSLVKTWGKNVIPVFLIALAIAISCNSEKILFQNEESEWWQPIMQKHDLKLGAYNNFDNVFEMGMEGNSINNGVCTLKVATVLIRNKANNSYMIIEADSVYHNIRTGFMEVMSGVGKVYKMNSDLTESPATLKGSWTINVKTSKIGI